jgi:thiosulfate/3-mercaptopyruvate sulfurtransferase
LSFSALITVEQLAPHVADGAWCVIDCRHDLSDFAAGGAAFADAHIPGAVFARIEDDLSGAKTGRNGRHPLPARDDLAATFRRWGISDDSQIVAYDSHGGSYAARLWWLARWLGHEQVAVLDGGWQAWRAGANPSASGGSAHRASGRFSVRAPLAALATADDVQAAAQSGRVLIDARAPARYRGETEPIDPVAGHIPGARSRFWQDNLIAGRFKSAQQLRAEFSALAAGDPPEALVHYCGSGVTAAHNALAMDVAAMPGSALYAGSWSEWIADPTHGICTGATA